MSDDFERDITGKTPEELEEKANWYYETCRYAEKGIEFEEAICLSPIPESKQPEGYDGPQRYCSQFCEREVTNPKSADTFRPRCKHHGGRTTSSGDNQIEKVKPWLESESAPNMKHGMYSTQERLKEYFDENDEKLFEKVMSWAEAYGFEEGTPEHDILEQAAVERVRNARSAEYLLDESEVQDEPVFDSEGNLVDEQDGENRLAEEHQRQRRLVLKILKELGLTPKERSNMNLQDAEQSAAEAMADIAKDAIEGGDYDPEDFEESESE